MDRFELYSELPENHGPEIVKAINQLIDEIESIKQAIKTLHELTCQCQTTHPEKSP